jgi:hypothetical protein
MPKAGKIMSSLIDPSNRNALGKQASIKGVARSAILKYQRIIRLIPRNFCLISGAPRSGTSALCEWLGDQPGVKAFYESRTLVSIHKFMDEVHRFRNLEKDCAIIAKLARRLVFDYYSGSRVLLGTRLLVDKEPLEPIAFPSRDYDKFLLNVRTLIPKSKLLFVIRDPIATIWSMSRRKWGMSLTERVSKEFSLEEYIDNWCSCTKLILKYKSDPNTYIVRYERLIANPENESQNIFNFLNISGSSFQPRQTKEIGFSNNEREKILQMVQPQLDLLNAQGISILS